MSTSFDATLTVELKRSPTLIAALCVMHAGAFAIVWIAPAGAITRAALVLCVALSAVYVLLRYGRLGGLSKRVEDRFVQVVSAVEWDSGGNWSLRYAGSVQWQPCELREYWLHPWLVILRLRSDGDGRTLSVLIPADAVAADAFRRLRARLRLQTAAA